MFLIKNKYIICAVFCVIAAFSFAQTQNMQSTSEIDWTTQKFSSTITLDIQKAGINMPSGRATAVERINMQIPLLVKDALLSVKVNSFTELEDWVLREDVTLEQLSQIIDNGESTPSYFSKNAESLQIAHSISLYDICAKMLSHQHTYKPKQPMDRIASRAYTGIVIDARGMLPVHGEFITEGAEPCLFPRIWDETMDLIYEHNMVQPDVIRANGVITYGYSSDISSYKNRVGEDPLVIKARQIYGTNRTDPVISRSDALRILSIPENIDLINQGKVVILIDKEKLIKKIRVPIKDDAYYLAYNKLKKTINDEDNIAAPPIDSNTGIVLAVNNVRFKPDSPEILPEEQERIDKIANIIKDALSANTFTILVEGHTARIGDIQSEMPLSIARAKTIVDEMKKRGIPDELFSYKGYGGNVPLASNDTPEGRALNRRVEITLQPVFRFTTWY
ncbi:MAG: OmpA family protein [Treponemataceae bacterium]|nr:OmpA family protein [Treponemataceae bacterium]